MKTHAEVLSGALENIGEIEMHGEMIYFGCVSDVGHGLHNSDGSRLDRHERNLLPFGESLLDTGLLKNVPQEQGLGTISVIRGWTIFSFWDRSVDDRPNSNSAIICHAVLDYCEIMRRYREQLPWLYERVSSKFNIRLTN